MVELLVGFAILGVIGTVVGGMFAVSYRSYQSAVHKTQSLTNARKSMNGSNDRKGFYSTIKQGESINSLQASRLDITEPDEFPAEFYASNQSLFRSQLGTPTKLADGVESVEFKYYSWDPINGIAESTEPAKAVFVTSHIRMIAKGKQPVFQFFTGARLRNH